MGNGKGMDTNMNTKMDTRVKNVNFRENTTKMF
jgi:hypothetical protein